MYYNKLFVHYIVYIKSHTNYHSDAFRHQMTPSAVSSVYCIFDTSEWRLHISNTGITQSAHCQSGTFRWFKTHRCTFFTQCCD